MDNINSADRNTNMTQVVYTSILLKAHDYTDSHSYKIFCSTNQMKWKANLILNKSKVALALT
jgi:hypothetical protein